MRSTLAIARRELSSFFFSPVAYVVIALFLLLAGFMFLVYALRPGAPAELRYMFTAIVWALVLVAPAVSMRLISDELRSGTIEPLMTAPVSDTAVIVGKWLGAMGFYAAMLLCTGVFVGVLCIFSDPDFGPILSGYVGLLLVGGFYLAIGTFASVFSRNQIIAFLITGAFILLFTVVTWFLPEAVPADFVQSVLYLNVNTQFEDFAKGVIDLRRFVFFLSGIVLFLALGVKALESRKWR